MAQFGRAPGLGTRGSQVRILLLRPLEIIGSESFLFLFISEGISFRFFINKFNFEVYIMSTEVVVKKSYLQVILLAMGHFFNDFLL